jgi:hypothetical protein
MKKLLLLALATVLALALFYVLVPGGEVVFSTITDQSTILAMSMMAAAVVPVRKPRRYLRKSDLCLRYGWKAGLSVDRNWKEYGTIPPPTIYRGRFPLWDEAILDAWDAERAFEASA